MAANNKTIYIFGNPLLDFDNMPIRMVPKLQKQFPDINFIIQDPNENINPSINGELVIIDTVLGIGEVVVINDIEKLEINKIYSMRDFDLAFNLKLLKKIGKLEKITIFSVPPELSEQKALKQLKKLMEKNGF